MESAPTETLYSVATDRFQSTLPIRRATEQSIAFVHSRLISIHAPHTESDVNASFLISNRGISIHAPHTESDATLPLVTKTF